MHSLAIAEIIHEDLPGARGLGERRYERVGRRSWLGRANAVPERVAQHPSPIAGARDDDRAHRRNRWRGGDAAAEESEQASQMDPHLRAIERAEAHRPVAVEDEGRWIGDAALHLLVQDPIPLHDL